MPKRNATSDLNHDNWNEDDVPEEAGTFQKAPPDIIEKRVIRNARRRGIASSGSAPSIFAGFQGFSKTPDNTSPLFSFLKKDNATQDSAGQDKRDAEELKSGPVSHATMFKPPAKEVPVREQEPMQSSPPITMSCLGAVRKLNECFLKHIQSCFEENKFIILSPCFRDYEQYLKGILPVNNSVSKAEGENQVSGGKVESLFPQKPEAENKSPSNADSGKKITFSENVNKEVPVTSGFKIIADGMKSPVNSSSTTIGTTSPFGAAAAKKPFSWMGAWGASSSPSQLSASESVKESPKGEPTGVGGGEKDEEESDAPPKAEFKQVVEEGAVYSRRCKVFVKKDNNYHDHGVGMLYLKPVEPGKKTQLIVRADTSLGNLLLNTLLNADMSLQKMGKNNVMLICLPTPDFKPSKPLPVLLRVKTSDDADELLKKLNEYKKLC